MKIIGHRGARGLAPENTLAAFQKALEAGVDEVELDVRVTKDDVPVLSHDRYMRDASGGELRDVRIHEHTLSELRAHRPDLATLEEIIMLVNRRVPIIIEVKPGEPVAPITAIVQRCLDTGWQPEDFLLASFSQRTLRALHAALPGIAIVINERFSAFRATRRARQLGATRLAFNHRNMWWFLLRSLTRSGFHVTIYTLNDQHKAERWLKYGLYGVVTDYPNRFIAPSEATTAAPLIVPTQSPPPNTATKSKHGPHSKPRRQRRSK